MTETTHTAQHSPDHTDLMTKTPHTTHHSLDCTDLMTGTPHTQHSPDHAVRSVSMFSDSNAVTHKQQQPRATHPTIYYGTVHKSLF